MASLHRWWLAAPVALLAALLPAAALLAEEAPARRRERVDQAALTVHVVCVSANRKGESAASGAVAPE